VPIAADIDWYGVSLERCGISPTRKMEPSGLCVNNNDKIKSNGESASKTTSKQKAKKRMIERPSQLT